MKKVIFVFIMFSLAGYIGLSFLWQFFDIKQPDPIPVITCRLNLQVINQRGVREKHNLSGSVGNIIVSPEFSGTLAQEKAPLNYPIVIYFDGVAIHFRITTDNGRIFGEGRSDNTPTNCAGKVHGTHTGPALEDQGNWDGQWKREKTTIQPQSIKPILFPLAYMSFIIGLASVFLVGWVMGKLSVKND